MSIPEQCAFETDNARRAARRKEASRREASRYKDGMSRSQLAAIIIVALIGFGYLFARYAGRWMPKQVRPYFERGSPRKESTRRA
jgi:hypothetical protein